MSDLNVSNKFTGVSQNSHENTCHCVKSVQSFFWSVFSCIWAEYGPEKTLHLDNSHAMCVKVSFLIVLQAQGLNFIKKETPAKVFSCEFCKIFKSTFIYGIPPVYVSAHYITVTMFNVKGSCEWFEIFC